MNSEQQQKVKRGAGWAVLILALAWMLYWAGVNWSSPAMLGHEFRQSQTALTAQVMQDQGFKLAYETPVLGKPWSIPMEFPFYQWLVAKMANLTGTEIIEAGRFTAMLGFLLGLPAWWLLARSAGYSRSASAVLLVPILLAPVYVFYSRTVMIESTAWALGAWFLWSVLRYRRLGDAMSLLGALVFGALAVLVKGTTWAVFCLPWAALFLMDAWGWLRHRRGDWRRLLVQALGVGVPLLVLGFAWVAFADSLKEQNPVANFLISRELREFNFGTWQARGDWTQWKQLAGHLASGVFPLWILGIGVLGSLFTGRTRRMAGLGLLALVGGPLVFFNLYYFHDYYFYANGAFAGGLLGVVAAEVWDRRSSLWTSVLPATVLLAGVGFAQHQSYRSGLLETQTAVATGDYGLTRMLRELTAPDDVIVVHSPSWGSSMPFFAKRRMLTIPDSEMFFHPDRVRASVELLSDENVPLLVVMGESRVQGQWTTERIDQLNLWPIPLFLWGADAHIYARIDQFEALRKRVRLLDINGAGLDKSFRLIPADQRRPIAGTEDGERVKALLGIDAAYGVFPFGYHTVGYEGKDNLLVHSVSELFFKVPAGARTLSFGIRVNPDSYQQRDFDGVCALVETVKANRIVDSLHFEWFSPQGDQAWRNVKLTLPEDCPDTIVFRLLAGPGDNKAYDQLWLSSFEFE